MGTTIIIVAGGHGSRMGAAQPKQFLPLEGKAILQHTLERFHVVDPTFHYMVVLPEEHVDYWRNHVRMKGYKVEHEIVAGGEERFFSVRNAVERLPERGVTMIHDGVRPLVSKATIRRVLTTAQNDGTAVAVMPVVDSIRKKGERDSHAVDRNGLYLVQTPQGFHNSILKQAYRQPYQSSFTDDATVVERMGHTIHLVDGNKENIKITGPDDMELAAYYLSKLK